MKFLLVIATALAFNAVAFAAVSVRNIIKSY